MKNVHKSYETAYRLEHDEKKKYILRKRQEFETEKELRAFFYAPSEFPHDDDPREGS